MSVVPLTDGGARPRCSHDVPPRSWDLRSGIGHWALVGGVAGLAMDAVMFTLRLALGVPSLPELLEDRATALLPGPVFSVLLDRLEFAGKPMLTYSICSTAAASSLTIMGRMER